MPGTTRETTVVLGLLTELKILEDSTNVLLVAQKKDKSMNCLGMLIFRTKASKLAR